jgi:hypothetical protein
MREESYWNNISSNISAHSMRRGVMIKVIYFTLLVGLVVGFLCAVPDLEEYWPIYVPLFLLVIMLMAITLALLWSRRPYNVAAIVIIVALWFAYFIRFFIIVVNPNSVWFLVPEIARSSFDDPSIRQASFIYLSAAFCTFCVSVIYFWLILEGRVERRRAERTTMVGSNEKVPSFWFVVFAILALFLLNIICLAYGIGKMGTFVENPLPFKLTGAVVYMMSVVVPCLLYLYIYLAQKDERFILARLGILAMLLSGLFDMFVYESRGALLWPLVFLGLLWLIAGFRLYKFDKLIFVAVLAGSFFIIPFITAARRGIPLETFSISQILDGINFVFFRMTGIDQFMVILNLGEPISLDKIWGIISSPRGVAGYYTTQLLNYGDDLPQTYAPSGLGLLYLIGGFPGIICGSVFLGFLVTYIWNSLGLIYSKYAPVVKTYFLVSIMVVVLEGTVERVIISLAIVAVLLLFMEKYLSIGNKPLPVSKIIDVKLVQA